MMQITFLGEMLPNLQLLHDIVHAGYAITLTQQLTPESGIGSRHDCLLIVSLEGQQAPIRMAQSIHRPGIPWLAWNRSDDQIQTLLAYASGASAVLPRDLTAAVLTQTMITLCQPQATPQQQRFGALQRCYRRGTVLRLEPETLLEISRGIVAQTMLHNDGSEALLGLYGPGQVLIAHPSDTCALQLVAHSDVTATLRPWRDIAHNPSFSERLWIRIQLMEAWAAMLARPHLDARLLGLLGLLAEQFGHPHNHGTCVDVRLTHTQLATAIGATRSTVTRLIGDLRARGLVSTIGTGDQERFCLHQWEGHRHKHVPPATSHFHNPNTHHPDTQPVANPHHR
jgi:CRP-like cAMP-binding protein